MGLVEFGERHDKRTNGLQYRSRLPATGHRCYEEVVPSPMDHVSHVVLSQHLLSMHRSRILVQRCTIPGVIHGSQSLDLNQLGGV